MINKKIELRKKAKQIRKSLDINEISKRITDKLLNLPEYKISKNIFSYHSFKDEVDTLNLFQDTSKNWFIPRVHENHLLVCEYDKNLLVENCFGIKESMKEHSDSANLDIVILPGLMADKSGNRLGYGKGYYDRFLSSLSHSPKKILLLPEELLIDELPIEEHDYKCEIIITQHNVYRV